MSERMKALEAANLIAFGLRQTVNDELNKILIEPAAAYIESILVSASRERCRVDGLVAENERLKVRVFDAEGKVERLKLRLKRAGIDPESSEGE